MDFEWLLCPRSHTDIWIHPLLYDRQRLWNSFPFFTEEQEPIIALNSKETSWMLTHYTTPETTGSDLWCKCGDFYKHAFIVWAFTVNWRHAEDEIKHESVQGENAFRTSLFALEKRSMEEKSSNFSTALVFKNKGKRFQCQSCIVVF